MSTKRGKGCSTITTETASPGGMTRNQAQRSGFLSAQSRRLTRQNSSTCGDPWYQHPTRAPWKQGSCWHSCRSKVLELSSLSKWKGQSQAPLRCWHPPLEHETARCVLALDEITVWYKYKGIHRACQTCIDLQLYTSKSLEIKISTH